VNETEYSPRNHILAKLKKDSLKVLLLSMELVEFDIREPLYEPNTLIDTAYFPDTGMISIVCLTTDGPSIEAATVGREGFVGVPLILGATTTPTKAFCQVPGLCWSVSAADLLRHVEIDAEFSLLLRQYAQTVFDLMAQSTACNCLHSIEERCARWLLITHDRVDSNSFQLTQEFLATMIGVRRSSVNLIARTLQAAGLIDYRHGKIVILNREGLEQVSCGCYAIVRDAFNKTTKTTTVNIVR
jgi:CRP-like cAMP-binding protein